MAVKTRQFDDVSGQVILYESGYQFPSPIKIRSKGYESVDSNGGNYGGNNPFFLHRTRSEGSIQSGRYGDRYGYSQYFDVPSALYSVSFTPEPPDVDNAQFTNRLFAAANPYRANILLPAFLAELRELPKLLHDLGRLKLNRKPIFHNPADLAKAWVGANFGWQPLIGDLVKLADFHLATEKRQEEFDRLYSSSGLVRRIKLRNVTTGSRGFNFTWGENQNIPSSSVTTTGMRETTSWGVVRYRPARAENGAPVRRPAPVELRRALAGLTIDGVTQSAWELVPWSWLIDYVYDVGGWLAARSSRRFLELERACIMTHVVDTITHPAFTATDDFGRSAQLSPGLKQYEWKTRTPVSSPTNLPQPHIAELSAVQLSILGSLTFLRSRGLK